MARSKVIAAAALLFAVSAPITARAQEGIPAIPSIPSTPAEPAAPAAMNAAEQERPFYTKAQGTKNAQAEAKFKEGYAAQLKEDYWSAAKAFRNAIELDPEFVAAHRAFIDASKTAKLEEEEGRKPGDPPKAKGGFMTKGRAIPLGAGSARQELLGVYQAWAQKYLNVAAVQWGMGEVTLGTEASDREKAAEYFDKSLILDPTCAPAYRSLSTVAMIAGDKAKAFEYQKKAAEADPDDADIQFDYAQSLENGDPVAFRAKVDEVVSRFPRHNSAMTLLAYSAESIEDPKERAAVLERVWKQYGHEANKPNYSYFMDVLYGLYVKTDLNKASELSAEMAKIALPEMKRMFDWDQMHSTAVQLVNAQSLLGKKQYAEATIILKKLKMPRGIDATGYYLMRAEAEGAGDANGAYQNLRTAAAREPNDALNAALMNFASKLGKSAKQVDDELWETRVKAATPFKDFELINYADGKPVKLSDFRGRTVLVNFWFPG